MSNLFIFVFFFFCASASNYCEVIEIAKEIAIEKERFMDSECSGWKILEVKLNNFGNAPLSEITLSISYLFFRYLI